MEELSIVGIILIIIGVVLAYPTCGVTLVLVFIGIILIVIGESIGSGYSRPVYPPPYAHAYNPAYNPPYPQQYPPQYYPPQYPPAYPPPYPQPPPAQPPLPSQSLPATSDVPPQKLNITRRFCPSCSREAPLDVNICPNCSHDFRKKE